MTAQPTMARIDLSIGGMTCASCANRVERKLNELDGVTATVAKEALALAAAKLPIKTRFVARVGAEG